MKNIGRLYEQWQSLRPLTEENQARLDRKFDLEFNYNSNNLEGNTLTYGQTELLLMFGQTSGDAKLRDYEEMQAHNVALKVVREEAANTSKPLTEKFIRDMNELILVKPFYKDAVTSDGSHSRIKVHIGGYKTRPNHVVTTTGEIFRYAAPEETPAMMTALVTWFNEREKEGDLHPSELASLLHYRFIRIHPFEDGNGRIARLLVNYVLMRHDYPMTIIKSERKEEYLQALHKADILVGLTPSDGANAELSRIEPFVDYMTEQLEYSLELCIKAARGESLDEPGDLNKKLHNLKKELGASQEKLKLKYSEEAAKSFILNTMFPLMNAWENTLHDFDELIFSRTSKVQYFASQPPAVLEMERPDFNSLIVEIKSENIHLFTRNVKRIVLEVEIHGIFGVHYSKKISGGSIFFDFSHNFYHVYNMANYKTISKMYHQSLSEEEINEIVEALGNKLLEEIEAKRS